MRTLCKKALAFCLVAALALTCFVGTFSVSAAEFGATISVAPVTVEQGETSVPVVLAINSADAGINEALIKVSSTVGTIDAEATLVKDAAGTAYNEDELELLDYSINYIQDATDYGSFYLSSKTTDSGVTAAFIKVVFTVAADKAAGDYAVAIDIPADKVIAASAAEDVINFTYAEANITIVLPHVHNVVWTSDDAGNHTSSCNVEGCPGFTPATEPCADGDDADALCDKCGYDLTPATPECQHENKTVISATPAVEGGDNGSIVFNCDDCGKEIEEVVTYFRNSMLAGSPTIGLNASTELNLRLNNNNYEGKGATDGFAVYTHKYINGAEPSVHVATIDEAKFESNYYIWTLPVKFNEFSDTYEIYVYSKHETGWVSGLVREFSIKSAAMTIVKDTSQPLGIRQVAANLLKAGAETQKLTTYEEANLADVELVGEYASLVTTTAPSIVKDGTNWVPCVDYSTDKEGYFVTPSVKLGDAVKFNTKAALKYYEGTYNVEDLKIVYSYTSFNTAEIIGEITSEDFVWTESNSRAEFDLGLIAPNMRSTINFQIYNGDTPISKVATYSIESAMAQALSVTPSYQAVINAVLNYSDCVKANADLF